MHYAFMILYSAPTLVLRITMFIYPFSQIKFGLSTFIDEYSYSMLNRHWNSYHLCDDFYSYHCFTMRTCTNCMFPRLFQSAVDKKCATVHRPQSFLDSVVDGHSFSNESRHFLPWDLCHFSS